MTGKLVLAAIVLVMAYAGTSHAYGKRPKSKSNIKRSCPAVLTGALPTTELTLRWAKNKIAYAVQTPDGWNGKTVVLVPGLGRNMHFWSSMMDDLFERGLRVVRMDPHNVGHTLNRTGYPDRAPTLKMDAQAVADVLNDAGISDDIYLIGHSRGAAVAALASLLLEDQETPANGIVAANPFVWWLTDYQRSVNDSSFGGSDVEDEFTVESGINPWIMPFEFARKAMTGIALDKIDERGVSPELARKALAGRTRAEVAASDATMSTQEDAVLEVLKGMEHDCLLREVHNIHSPVTVISSPNKLEPHRLIHTFRDRLPYPSPLQYLDEGSDHLFPLSNRLRFLAILDAFLREHPGPKTAVRP